MDNYKLFQNGWSVGEVKEGEVVLIFQNSKKRTVIESRFLPLDQLT